MGPRAGLDQCGKSRPNRDWIPGRPARNQSLYRLSYPAHLCRMIFIIIHRYTYTTDFDSFKINVSTFLNYDHMLT